MQLGVAGIVPLYNKRNTVEDAIESMLAQTRPLDEIVIVDDGSTDGSGELVQQRYGGHPLIRLIRGENQGVSAARNAAIRASRSPLLAFLDADDKWLPQRVERQLAIMETKPECMIVLPSALVYNGRLQKTWIEGNCINKQTYLPREFWRQDCHIACSGVMVRRSALVEVGMFDESLWMGEDADLWLRIMLRFGFEHLEEPVVWIRSCRSQELESVERGFLGNDRYFAKHRYTFGRGIRGQLIWRAGYASVLRRHAMWYLQNGHGWAAFRKLVKAAGTWPLFNPLPVTKECLMLSLGPRRRRWVATGIRTLLRMPKRNQER